MGEKSIRSRLPEVVVGAGAMVLTAVVWTSMLVAGPVGAQASPGADGTGPGVSIDEPQVPAAGRATATLTVERPGRYAIEVESARGTALQLVDRMAGPGARAGQPGRRDGRLDLLLDRGTYRLVTTGPEAVDGQATLRAQAFEELAVENEALPTLRLVTTTLGDRTQRSYWLDVPRRERVYLEAAGRYLADLRLWRDGAWLIDAEPEIREITSTVGQPLGRCRLHADLEPGRYRVTAYGGPERAWSTPGAGTDALYLRAGIPRLAEAGRASRTLGPFGADHFLVPASATYVRLALPSPAAATLELGSFAPQRPWTAARQRQRFALDRQAAVPVIEARRNAEAEGYVLVSVAGDAGQPYVLQHFAAGLRTIEGADGTYWISTVHAGDPRDALAVTGVVTAIDDRITPRASQAIPLGPSQGWVDSGNLVGPATLFFDVEAEGTYTVLADGVDVRVRIEPLLLPPPRGYQSPDPQPPGSTFDLGTGLHVMSVEPVDAERLGRLDLVARATTAATPTLADAEAAAERASASLRFGAVRFEPRRRYGVVLGDPGGVAAGTVVRRLPLDPRQPLPLVLAPGETATIPIEVPVAGRLVAEIDSGFGSSRAADLTVGSTSLDGAIWSRDRIVAPGRHFVHLRNDREHIVWLHFGFEASTPPLKPLAEASADDDPRLRAGAPLTLELERGAARSFRVTAETPALYRLETTGLLATEANLRTRVLTSLDRRAQNGVGRNALLQNYLRAGDYHLTVKALGRSTGPLGVRLRRAPVRDGGALRPGIPARGRLTAGEAVAYGLEVSEAGRHRFDVMALGRTLRMRLEDDDGWPVTTPGVDGSLELDLTPGRYRLIVLPSAVDARHLVSVTRQPAAVVREGHGPHDLPFDEGVRHRWLEPSRDGAPRTPDTWRFTLPARGVVAIELTDEMQADIVRIEETPAGAPTETVVGYVPPERGWRDLMEPGTYALRVTCVRIDNRVDYRLSVRPEPLMPGLTRVLTVPTEVDVAVGDGLVEIDTFGVLDVHARLYDDDGRLVAENDDRPGDWNALIAQRLAAGTYRLRLERSIDEGARGPVGETAVSVRTPPIEQRDALEVPAHREVALGDGVVVMPLALPGARDVVVVEGRSAEPVGVILEAEDRGTWRTLAQQTGNQIDLLVPLASSPTPRAVRLRAWSLDRRGNPLELRVDAPEVPVVQEAAWDGGRLPTGRASLDGASWHVAAVTLERPGCFRVADAWVSRGGDHALQPLDGVAAMTTSQVWLAWPRAKERRHSPRFDRVVLSPDTPPITVAVPPGGRALCDVVASVEDEGQLLAVDARSAAGEPLVAWVDEDATRIPLAVAVADGPRASTVGRPDANGRATVMLWSRTPAVPLEAQVSVGRHRVDDHDVAGWGTHDVRVEADENRRLSLPPGAKAMHLVADAELLLALDGGETGSVLSVHGGLGKRLDERFTTEAERLVVLGGATGGIVRIAVVPDDQGRVPSVPRAGLGWVWQPPAAGHLRLMRRGTSLPGTLHVRGAEVRFWTGDGQILTDSAIPGSTSGGVLRLAHGTEPVTVWHEPAPGRADLPAAEAIQASEGPVVIDVDREPRHFDLAVEQPTLLRVRGEGPLVVEIRRGDLPPQVELFEDAVALDAFVAHGSVSLVLRPLRDGWRQVTLDSTPVPTIGEGLGPEVLLAGGDTRAFAFEVERDGAIGVGARADRDRVTTRLLTEDGEMLGDGVVHMHEVIRGRFVLLLSLAADEPPVRARPAVVGLDRPGTGPPGDVLRSYLALAAAACEDGSCAGDETGGER